MPDERDVGRANERDEPRAGDGDTGGRIEARLWSVLRFQDADSPRIDIYPPEAERLQRLLNQILERRMKHRPSHRAAPAMT